MATLTKSQRSVNERTTLIYAAILEDDSDPAVPIALASIDSAQLTLKDVDGDTVINSRSAQDILNTNNCTIHATTGAIEMEFLPADNVIVDTTRGRDAYEEHEATFDIVYSTTKRLTHTLVIFVKQLRAIT